MKKIFLFLSFLVTSVTIFSQTEIPVSTQYVLDGETGELIQIVYPEQQQIQYVKQVAKQPERILVVNDRQTKVEKTLNTVTNVVTTAIMAGAVIHAVKHQHYHPHYYDRYSYHMPMPRIRPYNYRPMPRIRY